MRDFRQPRHSHPRVRLFSFHNQNCMNVLALTILISSCLAGIFIACFAAEMRRSRRSSPERDSLLPLDLEPVARPKPADQPLI